MGRFADFTDPERASLHDGLMRERDLESDEDPSFPERIAIAEALLEELYDDGFRVGWEPDGQG